MRQSLRMELDVIHELVAYKPKELVLVKMKVSDKQWWPGQIDSYDKASDTLQVKWLFNTHKQ